MVSPADAGFLQSLVESRLVFPELQARNMEDALSEVARRLAAAGVVADEADLARRLLERERLGSTGLGAGIAIPHCKLRELRDVVLAVAMSGPGVDFHSSDGIPVSLIFLILSPADMPALHLQALARISRVLRRPGVADRLRVARSAEEIAGALRDAEGNAA
ncbi:MAG: PTS sugar transporter subunit IIA [Thermoanaerobaculia bacterium]|nr:PTS sugar transporter subunit IIA [Thermoanaerobaculia bacterium]